ncbi:nicotinamidase [bacterium]|nr:nicotinamidase [bacterium]
MKTLPLPSFYRAANAEKWEYRPNHRKLVEMSRDWRGDYGIKASATDKKVVTMLVIDGQKDFLFPQGSLYVGGRSGRGAIEDTVRTVEFTYRNMPVITHMRATFDTHFPFQIFSPAFLLDADGKHPQPFTFIVAEEDHKKPWMTSVLVFRKGEVRANPDVAGWLCGGDYSSLQKQIYHYCTKLHETGKYDLIAWPEHCILGDDGHALSGVLHEARMFHSYVRGIQAEAEVKGGHPLTENYSVLGPEVTTYWDGRPMAQKNARFVKTLLKSDYVWIVGQAGSHCVAASTDDLLAEISAQDPELAKKVYVLTDCMSAVTVPDGRGGFYADFTPQMESAFQRWADAGMHLVKSTDPVENWPGLVL